MNIKEYKVIPRVSGIYRITNQLDKKFYIGSAVNLYLRIQRHLNELESNKHYNKHLQRSFIKNGSDVFEIDIIEKFESIDYNLLLLKEKNLIIGLNAIKIGYNQMLDNSTHFKSLNKSKKHINKNIRKTSKPVLGFCRFNGKLKFEFTSISDAARNVKDQSTNISRCCKGSLNYVKDIVWIYKKDYDKEKDYCFKDFASKGRKFSKEHTEKIRQKIIKNKGRKVYVYDENYKLKKVYSTISEIEKKLGMKKDTLRTKLDTNKLHLGYYYYRNERKI